jgi:hypothetical protein
MLMELNSMPAKQKMALGTLAVKETDIYQSSA